MGSRSSCPHPRFVFTTSSRLPWAAVGRVRRPRVPLPPPSVHVPPSRGTDGVQPARAGVCPGPERARGPRPRREGRAAQGEDAQRRRAPREAPVCRAHVPQVDTPARAGCGCGKALSTAPQRERDGQPAPHAAGPTGCLSSTRRQVGADCDRCSLTLRVPGAALLPPLYLGPGGLSGQGNDGAGPRSWASVRAW